MLTPVDRVLEVSLEACEEAGFEGAFPLRGEEEAWMERLELPALDKRFCAGGDRPGTLGTFRHTAPGGVSAGSAVGAAPMSAAATATSGVTSAGARARRRDCFCAPVCSSADRAWYIVECR